MGFLKNKVGTISVCEKKMGKKKRKKKKSKTNIWGSAGPSG